VLVVHYGAEWEDVGRPWDMLRERGELVSENRKFLGHSFWNRGGTVKRRVAPKALEAMKERVREITSRNRGRNIQSVFEEPRRCLTGRKEDYKLAETPYVFRNSDSWIRRRLRAVQLKRWRRGTTVYRKLRSRGVPDHPAAAAASHAKRWWLAAAYKAQKITLPDSYCDRMGVPRLVP